MKKFKILSVILCFTLLTGTALLSQTRKTKSAPVSSLYNDGKIDYATSAAKFTIASEDALSAVKAIFYKIDKGEFAEYKQAISIADEGLHTIYYYSVDNVGNKSSTVAYPVVIDNTPPDVVLSPDFKPYSANKKLYVPITTKYSINASDALSGVKIMEYSIDGGKYIEYTKPFTIDKPGEHTIKYRATDNVGNISEEKSLTVFVDNVKPAVKIIPAGSFFEKDKKQYAPKSFQYQIEASDTESGVAKILVSIDGGDYVIYESPISIEKEGEHTISAKAIDNVGNESDEVKLTFMVDATPPKVELTPSAK